MITLITMVMHHQKKDLGLKLFGDEIKERQAMNKEQCFQFIQNNYKARPMDPAKPNVVTLYKKIRRIEQESKIPHETYE